MSEIADRPPRNRIDQIESLLWNHLHTQDSLEKDKDLEKTKEDIHYLEGKKEGFEEALVIFYGVKSVEDIYEYEKK